MTFEEQLTKALNILYCELSLSESEKTALCELTKRKIYADILLRIGNQPLTAQNRQRVLTESSQKTDEEIKTFFNGFGQDFMQIVSEVITTTIQEVFHEYRDSLSEVQIQ